jgi:uncharacterized protein (UPF0218 family)
LAIPAVLMSPESSGVYYGQPGEGMVLVKATRTSKARNKALLAKMGAPSES